MKIFRERKGFALMAVLGVLTLLVVYLAAAEGSMLATITEMKQSGRRLERRLAASSILQLVSMWELKNQTQTIELEDLASTADSTLSAEVELRSLSPDQASLAEQGAPGVEYMPGDAIVTIHWKTPPATIEDYLINVHGNRQGIVLLGNRPTP